MSQLIRWEIIDVPTSKDPQRRRLLVKAALSDIHLLIRRFGAMCGRPKKERSSLFNYSLFLHQAGEDTLLELKDELRVMSGHAEARRRSDPTPAPPPAAGLQEEPLPPAPPQPPLPPPGAELAAAPLEAEPVLPESPPIPSLSPPEPAMEPAAAPELAPISLTAPAPSVPEEPPRESAGVELPMPAPPQADPVPDPGPSPAAAAPAPGVSTDAGDKRRSEKPLCGVSIEPDAAKSVEGMQAGSFNRFAQAAATSVIANPGAMYNPLLLHGPTGSGKTHFLHAMALKLGTKSSGAPVVLTTGPRLARAVSAAQAAGKWVELEALAGRACALLIDDLHLLEITDRNAEGLAKFVGTFLGAKKQIAAASVYDAATLAPIDTALGLNLAQGHAVELKAPPESAAKEIALAALASAGIEAEDVGIGQFIAAVGSRLGGLEAAVSRLERLKTVRENLGQPTGLGDLLAIVFAPDSEGPPPTADAMREALPGEPARGGSELAAVFFPEGAETAADYAWHRICDTASKNKWPFPFQQSLKRPYAADPGAPFAIAGDCYNDGIGVVLVLGPNPGSDLAAHSEDFRYSLDRLVRDVPSAVGWMPPERLHDPKAAALAYLDMTSARRA